VPAAISSKSSSQPESTTVVAKNDADSVAILPLTRSATSALPDAAVIPLPGSPERLSSWETALALATIDLVAAYRQLQRMTAEVLPLDARVPFELVCSGVCATLDAVDLLGASVWEAAADTFCPDWDTPEQMSSRSSKRPFRVTTVIKQQLNERRKNDG
jgi:hypothetical protein